VTSIIFGLGTAVFFACSTLLSDRAVRRIDPWSVVAWVTFFGLIWTIPFLLTGGIPETLTPDVVRWMAVSGLGNVGGLALTAFALRIGKVGVVAPIVATEGAIAAVLAASLGESIAPIIAFFLFLIVIGVIIAAAGPDPAPIERERPVLAALLATAAALSFGLSLFATGYISGDLPSAWVLLPARLVGSVAIFLPLLLTGRLHITKLALPMVIGMSITEFLGFWSFSLGARDAVGVTSVLASQFAPIAAVAAYFLFKEKLGRIQIAGVVLLVFSVSALTFITAQ
jgi:drug/metabolite transporter (DMT)-like permease